MAYWMGFPSNRGQGNRTICRISGGVNRRGAGLEVWLFGRAAMSHITNKNHFLLQPSLVWFDLRCNAISLRSITLRAVTPGGNLRWLILPQVHQSPELRSDDLQCLHRASATIPPHTALFYSTKKRYRQHFYAYLLITSSSEPTPVNFKDTTMVTQASRGSV